MKILYDKDLSTYEHIKALGDTHAKTFEYAEQESEQQSFGGAEGP
jgi:hypothetical protein